MAGYMVSMDMIISFKVKKFTRVIPGDFLDGLFMRIVVRVVTMLFVVIIAVAHGSISAKYNEGSKNDDTDNNIHLLTPYYVICVPIPLYHKYWIIFRV